MKKILTMVLGLGCVLTAMACSSGSDDVDGVTGATQPSGGDEGTAKGKALVVYFSRAGENWQVGVVERGNTAVMVDYIKEAANVDVFEIVPVVAYPENYQECIEYVTNEINNNERPAYQGDVENIGDYGTVFIGGPIWWARPPMIIRTFLEAHPELGGKTLVPFGTHGGSGVGSYTSLLREYFPEATILEALGIAGVDIRSESARTTVENWLKRLGLDKESTGQNDDYDMEQVKQEIEQWLTEWGQAMVDADTAKLSSMMADDIVVRHITGRTQTKREWLDEVASGSMDYHEIHYRDVEVNVIDRNNAELSYTSVITATIWGGYGTWTLQGSGRLARRNGKWISINRDSASGIRQTRSTLPAAGGTAYSLNGILSTGRGIYIKNGKKYYSR